MTERKSLNRQCSSFKELPVIREFPACKNLFFPDKMACFFTDETYVTIMFFFFCLGYEETQ
jgi:hypothetical protein